MHVQRPDFEDLVERFYEPLYRFAFSLTKSADGACDLTQQTFYLWAAKGHQLRDATKVKSWLFTTLHREFLGSRRRETRFPHQSLEDAGVHLPSVSPAVVNAMDAGLVMEALTEVDEVYRVPLSLFYMEQLSYQEIADTLEIPIGTVMSRLSRGKQQLRQLLSVKASPTGRKIVPLTSHQQTGKQSHG
jgi:RNA polymerase sigma-70 factor, ECF subfamily